MPRYQALFIGLPILSAVLALSTPASAHHESWILKNAGTQCAFDAPRTDGADNYFATTLYNGATSARWMSCPVALSARWGSSNPSAWPIARWARAYSADVYVINNPGQTLSCMARAFMSPSTLRFSRTVSTTLGGYQRLSPVNYSTSNWGGTLEAAEGETLRALDFVCNVPGNYSGVVGHKVRICIRNAACGDSRDPDVTFTTNGGGGETVQTSGIECTSDNPSMERGHFGIRNNSTGWGSVQCPIVPSADDTNEVTTRQVSSTVHFKPQNILQDDSPTCQVAYRKRTPGSAVGDEFWSDAFTHRPWDHYAVSPQGLPVGQDVSMAVWCDLPPGMTLQGITTGMTVAPVSGGF